MAARTSKKLLPKQLLCKSIFSSLLLFFLQFGVAGAFALEGADKALTIEKLENGLTVAVWEDRSKPIVTVDAWGTLAACSGEIEVMLPPSTGAGPKSSGMAGVPGVPVAPGVEPVAGESGPSPQAVNDSMAPARATGRR